jgi:hypothetical protein
VPVPRESCLALLARSRLLLPLPLLSTAGEQQKSASLTRGGHPSAHRRPTNARSFLHRFRITVPLHLAPASAVALALPPGHRPLKLCHCACYRPALPAGPPHLVDILLQPISQINQPMGLPPRRAPTRRPSASDLPLVSPITDALGSHRTVVIVNARLSSRLASPCRARPVRAQNSILPASARTFPGSSLWASSIGSRPPLPRRPDHRSPDPPTLFFSDYSSAARAYLVALIFLGICIVLDFGDSSFSSATHPSTPLC